MYPPSSKVRARPRIAWVWVEPTPYMLAGETRVRAALSEFEIDVFWHTINATQNWNADGAPPEGHVVRSPGNGRDSALRDYRRFWHLLESGDYALCLVEGYGSPTAVLAIAWAEGRRIPWVMESDTQLVPRPSYIRFLKRALLPPLLRRASWLLPGGSRQAEYLMAYGAMPAKVSKACMTVDVERMREKTSELQSEIHTLRSSVGVSGRDVLLLFVGRLVPEKGLDVLLAAMKMLQGDVSQASVSFRVALIGDGPQRGQLQEMCLDLDLADLVLFCGAHYGDSLLGWYAAADAFVLPSRREPWGLVINEAMAAGLPVVVSDAVGASTDLVEHGVNGYLFPSGDAARLAARLKTLIEHPARRRRMGLRSGRKIEQWTLGHYSQVVAAAVRNVLRREQELDRV